MTASEDNDLDEVFAEARPADPAGLALVRARVASALFGSTATLGRFHVLERLGRGGMGVVYAAYDPELDRKVALKMVSVPIGGREVALAEAKALAKLSHPNVVPVFDVGLVDDHVYIVMELVRGETLRDWVATKRSREIVDVYRQAGQALAAAHAAKLVHRDFKPDNAIVGADGRVRVVDFGLASEAAAAEPHRTGGTPKYMAPERSVTPAADQYSFCVALAEALGEPGTPLPRWVETIVERGRAVDPDDRFASMHELVRALGRDPARVWKRRAIAAGLVGVAIAAFFIGRARSVAEAELCGGGDRELATSWPPSAREAQVARIAAMSTYGRELAPRVTTSIASFSTRWIASYRDACLTRRNELQSETMLDRRMACLERGRNALATVAEIASAADVGTLVDIARAVAALPEPEQCSDLVTLASEVATAPASVEPRLAPLRKDIERARVQLAAGRSNLARGLAHGAAAQLRTLDYPPLLAETLLVEGHALMTIDDVAAVAALREATTTGFASGIDAVGVEAWARRAWLEGVTDHADALAGLDVVDVFAKRIPRARFARALLLNNVGSVELARGHRSEARASFAKALEVARDVTGPGAVELVAIRRNLALVTDDLDQRDRLQADATAELARLLGPTHPDTLTSQYTHAATGMLHARDAAALLATTCSSFEQHERLATQARACFAELADLRDELGDATAALAAIDRAVAFPESTQSGVPELAGYQRLWRGDTAGALRAFEVALAAHPLQPDQPFYKNLEHAKLRLGQARALRTAGKLDDARRALVLSLDAFRGADDHATVAIQRRVERVRAELAAVLAATAGKPDEIHALATRALAWYRRTGATPERLAELERLTGA